MKPYDVGLVCGRFQTFHKGHEKLIDTGLLLCDRMLRVKMRTNFQTKNG